MNNIPDEPQFCLKSSVSKLYFISKKPFFFFFSFYSSSRGTQWLISPIICRLSVAHDVYVSLLTWNKLKKDLVSISFSITHTHTQLIKIFWSPWSTREYGSEVNHRTSVGTIYPTHKAATYCNHSFLYQLISGCFLNSAIYLLVYTLSGNGEKLRLLLYL